MDAPRAGCALNACHPHKDGRRQRRQPAIDSGLHRAVPHRRGHVCAGRTCVVLAAEDGACDAHVVLCEVCEHRHPPAALRMHEHGLGLAPPLHDLAQLAHKVRHDVLHGAPIALGRREAVAHLRPRVEPQAPVRLHAKPAVEGAHRGRRLGLQELVHGARRERRQLALRPRRVPCGANRHRPSVGQHRLALLQHDQVASVGKAMRLEHHALHRVARGLRAQLRPRHAAADARRLVALRHHHQAARALPRVLAQRGAAAPILRGRPAHAGVHVGHQRGRHVGPHRRLQPRRRHQLQPLDVQGQRAARRGCCDGRARQSRLQDHRGACQSRQRARRRPSEKACSPLMVLLPCQSRPRASSRLPLGCCTRQLLRRRRRDQRRVRPRCRRRREGTAVVGTAPLRPGTSTEGGLRARRQAHAKGRHGPPLKSSERDDCEARSTRSAHSPRSKSRLRRRESPKRSTCRPKRRKPRPPPAVMRLATRRQ